ncbi:helix-turn-helix domain-containing protein [Clostridium sp.]|jgi:excisionase family DNA binding protein|uniref:helix-turn-helix domain-containing protein n=1 Tax=Clostridium sp. TaxID=1506 RepID=UPI003EECF5E4
MESYLYTVAEVSEILKVNKNAVYELINHGLLQGLKLGSMKITKLEVVRFLDTYNGKNLDDLDNIKDLMVVAN